jgi:hypothetical protein
LLSANATFANVPSANPTTRPIKVRSILLRDYQSGSLTSSDKTSVGPTNIQSSDTGCVCNNFLESAEFSFILDKVTFEIKDVVLDVILFTNIRNNCNEPFIFSQFYSAKFVYSTTSSFVKSGSPGYNQASRLLVGYNTTTSGKVQFNVPYDGFYLMGRRYDGTCSDLNTDSASNLMSQFDSQILYGLNTLYSCTNQFSLRDLQNFCEENKWKNYIIFNFIKNIQYIGIFGNANNTYIKVVFNKVGLDTSY